MIYCLNNYNLSGILGKLEFRGQAVFAVICVYGSKYISGIALKVTKMMGWYPASLLLLIHWICDTLSRLSVVR